jgi:hypothetical protein
MWKHPAGIVKYAVCKSDWIAHMDCASGLRIWITHQRKAKEDFHYSDLSNLDFIQLKRGSQLLMSPNHQPHLFRSDVLPFPQVPRPGAHREQV